MGIIESVQQYDMNIPAGGAQAIDVAGDRVQFLSATDPFAQIEIRPNFAQGNITLKPGQGFKFSQQVTRWVVFNRGSLPLSGYLMIGSGDFFDQRISGEVSVIDGGRARTMAGQVGSASATQGAVAAMYAKAGIWNPAGSGKRLMLKRVYVGSSTAQLFYQARISAPLSTLGGAAALLLDGSAFTGAGRATAEATSNAAGTGNVASTFGSFFAIAAQTVQVQYDEPVVVMPGNGLVFVCNNVNTDITVTIPFYEETIG